MAVKYAYKFWYIFDEGGRTEYLNIIAYTEKQARYFFLKSDFNKAFDTYRWPIEISKIGIDYKIGTILGEGANLFTQKQYETNTI